MTKRSWRDWLVLVALFCFPLLSVAAHSLQWERLSPTEQALLAPARERWNTLPAERQQKLRDGAAHWSQMKPDEHNAATAHWRDWQRLDPAR